jgi:hypothetical protein
MPRAGTTYLYSTLAKHPQVHISYRKESHYFSVNYIKGSAWYESLYEGLKPEKLPADINPMYFLDPLSPERIAKTLNRPKVVLGVRNPIDFIISLYGNVITHGGNPPPINDWVNGFAWNLSDKAPPLEFSLTERPIRRIISDWANIFGTDLLLYDFAYFETALFDVLQAIEKHVGLTPYLNESNADNTKINATGRRNFWLANRLIANPRFLETVYRFLPNRLICLVKINYDRLAVRGTQPNQKESASVTIAEREMLEERFRLDMEFYHHLFSEYPIINGNRVQHLK